MKIGEFAELNKVTTKMLRHYDEIGLLKPSAIDSSTGYRSYKESQSLHLSWILLLKNLDFSLTQIKDLLGGPVETRKMICELIRKRIDISSALNEQIQKKLEIDRLIKILEKEGFQMDRYLHLLDIDRKSIHEIKKNFPNMEMFLEEAQHISSLCTEQESVFVFRYDISHFKRVNDDFGFEVGDRVIVACYEIIKSNIGKHFAFFALGRAHGDEFIVFAKAGSEEAEGTASSIIKDMKSFDFSGTGCNYNVGCCIGGLVSSKKSVADIRILIENTIETVNRAKENGPNSVIIQEYSP